MDGNRNIKNIALVGFSATGKTEVAEKVAAFLSWQAIDIDNEVVKRSGKAIEDIFEQDGEEHFRLLEHEELKKNCTKEHVVIATGGGILIDPRNRELLNNNCLIINLEAKIETIYRRLFENEYKSGSSVIRPLLSGNDPMERIRELKSSRQHLYTESADRTIHTDNMTIDEISAEVANIWYIYCRSSVNSLAETNDVAAIVNTTGGVYPVFVQSGLIERVGEKLRQFGFSGKVIVISDNIVYALYGNKCIHSTEKSGFKTFHFVVPAGETSKSHTEAAKIYDFLIQHRIERNDVIVALGGGMIGDLAGFIAATYLRGVPWIQVPTTLIGMVDASIGGKVAVNHTNGKNLIGAFYQPQMVLEDITTLSTLPERELNSGWAEVIKHGLIIDEEFFELLERSSDRLLRLEPENTAEVVARSARIKAKVVSEDEKEKGKRIILNYGHTVAHGLEAATDYKVFLHGEAVSIGMMAAAMISSKSGFLSPDVVSRQRNILEHFKLPIDWAGITVKSVLTSMHVDKKVRNEAIKWVLLEDIGKTKISDTVDNNVILEVLHEVIKS
jgi:shikimate kinase/3-dehydroquinate synthase